VREKLYVWPLYGYRKDGELERRFWLWPLVSRERNEWGRKRGHALDGGAVLQQCDDGNGPPPGRAAPAAEAEPELVGNRTKLWPLYSRRYDLEEGSYRLRLLDLWPGPVPPPVERSWAPLWTVLDVSRAGGGRDLDVLWGLYRDDAAGGGRAGVFAVPAVAARADGRGRGAALVGAERIDCLRPNGYNSSGALPVAGPDSAGAAGRRRGARTDAMITREPQIFDPPANAFAAAGRAT
jgi:hypothetical protein